jgi:hypothetical protein
MFVRPAHRDVGWSLNTPKISSSSNCVGLESYTNHFSLATQLDRMQR